MGRGDARDKNAPLNCIEVTHNGIEKPLAQALVEEGIQTKTFDICGPSFYYMPAMMMHQFIDRSCTTVRQADSASESNVGSSQSPKKRNPKTKSPKKKNSAVQKKATAAKSTGAGKSKKTNSRLSRLKKQNPPGKDQDKRYQQRPSKRKQQQLKKLYEERRREVLRMSKDYKFRPGEVLHVKKDVVHLKLAKYVSVLSADENEEVVIDGEVVIDEVVIDDDDEDDAGEDDDDDDGDHGDPCLPKLGSTLSWNTPALSFVRGDKEATMNLIHLEYFATPGTHWEEIESTSHEPLVGSKYNLLRKALRNAKACFINGDKNRPGRRLYKVELHQCQAGSLRYTDVIKVDGKWYGPVVSMTRGVLRKYVRRCKDNVERGNVQMGFVAEKDPESQAECVFTPRVYVLRMTEMSDEDKQKIKKYCMGMRIWSPSQVSLFVPNAFKL